MTPTKPNRATARPNLQVTGPDTREAKPGGKGALFRALVKAGADPEAAYNAEAGVGSMAAENVVAQLGAQMQVGFTELKQVCRENAERLAEHSRKLDAQTEAGIARDRKVEILAAEVSGLKEILAAELSGLKEALAAEVSGLKAVSSAEVSGLKEVSGAQMGAVRRELRLVWGALGILVTVLLAVFGFLFTR